MARFVFLTFYDTVSIGIRHFSSILKKEGHEVSLIFFKDMSSGPVESDTNGIMHTIYQGGSLFGFAHDVNPPTNHELTLLRQLIAEKKPDVLGISTRSFWLNMGTDIIKDLKADNPQMITIAGGFGPTLQPEEFAKICDYICYGEGDKVITKLAQTVDSGKLENIRDLNNIGYIADDGSLVMNEPETPITNLDELPYPEVLSDDHYLIDSNQLKNGTSSFTYRYHVLATRGCPFSCSYCMAGQWNRLYENTADIHFPKVRVRSPEKIVDEISNAIKVLSQKGCSITTIQFEDSCFPHKAEWLDKFCKLYKSEIGLPFECNIDPRYHSLIAKEKIYKAGCRATSMGIQSGNEGIREHVYNRRIKNKLLIQHASWIYDKKDISAQHDILAFNPFETEETLKHTFEFICRLPLLPLLTVFRLGFYPNSPLGQLYDKEKPQGLSDDHHRTWIYLWHLAARGHNYRKAAQQIVKSTGGATPLNHQQLIKGLYDGSVTSFSIESLNEQSKVN